MSAPVKPIAALDVPAEQLARDIARRKIEDRLGRILWLIRHPEWPTGRQSDGIAAEYRHLLHDADSDASTEPFPYPTVESAAACRCDEPGADPYSCEADDCGAEFSELNPFGGSTLPVEKRSAEVSRSCGCGWSTSVWHVDDGSAEEELHGHVTRVHEGIYPAPKEASHG